ncbi:hypothetical protein PF003_g34883 [Phytophthora fragariae]|nr:hypothetical protein PF003_g34883 [Phytophthora fragariae]
MLTSVALVCGRYPAVHALEQDTKAVSRFLGPSRSLSLSKACAFGSTELLDWIWESSCPTVDTQASRWSLCNYFRTDRHYYKWSFENSMKEAAGGGDLEVLEWLVAHFSDCQVPVSAVKEAAKAGQLSVLQFLWGSSSDGEGQDVRELEKRNATESCSVKLGGSDGIPPSIG